MIYFWLFLSIFGEEICQNNMNKCDIYASFCHGYNSIVFQSQCKQTCGLCPQPTYQFGAHVNPIYRPYVHKEPIREFRKTTTTRKLRVTTTRKPKITTTRNPKKSRRKKLQIKTAKWAKTTIWTTMRREIITLPTTSTTTTTTTTTRTTTTTSTTTTTYLPNRQTDDDGCVDKMPTCSSLENYCHEGLEQNVALAQSLCAKTCGICGKFSSLLILNSDEFGVNQAVRYTIQNDSESLDTLDNFKFDAKTESFKSCSVKFDDKLLVYGGFYQTRQISEISKDCALKRIGSLPFDFSGGSCQAFSNFVLLCFHLSDSSGKRCWKSEDGFNFAQIPETTFDHWNGNIATFRNKVIAIAGSMNTNVEMFDTNVWITLPSIPGNEKLYGFSSLTLEDVLYIFGGDDGDGALRNVWAFDGQWTKMLPLLDARTGHRSTLINQKIYHSGGIGNKKRRKGNQPTHNKRYFEEWCIRNLASSNVNRIFYRRRLDDYLENFDYYPEAFIVDNRYCNIYNSSLLLWNS